MKFGFDLPSWFIIYRRRRLNIADNNEHGYAISSSCGDDGPGELKALVYLQY